MDPILLDNTPILCNKYVVGKNEGFVGPIPGKGKSTLDSIFYRCYRLEQKSIWVLHVVKNGNRWQCVDEKGDNFMKHSHHIFKEVEEVFVFLHRMTGRLIY